MRISIVRTLGLALALALCGFAGAAAAADDVGKLYLAPMAYAVWTGAERQVDDNSAASLAFGKNFSDDWSAEISASHARFNGTSYANNLDINTFNVDVLRHFYRESRVHPYFVFGVLESVESREATGKYERQMVEGGIGVLANLSTAPDRHSVWQLRLEAKARWAMTLLSDPNQGSPADFLAGIGLQYNWGAPAPAPMPVREEVPPPAPAPPAAPPPPKDSDGDGVPDDIDECPNTPPGVKVDAKGCPLDSDHDGVPDYLDKCPGTPPGVKVDANGCEIEAIVLRGVNFDFDSARLTPASEKVLDDVVVLLKLRTGSPAILGGHTDSRGKHAYNLALSERRANAVRDYLVAHGIAASALTAKGYGDTMPIASNKTDAGRAENRRVTLEFKRLEMR